MKHQGFDCSSPGFASSVLQDSASLEGALDSKIVAATIRKLAKLSSEAGRLGKFENCWRLPNCVNIAFVWKLNKIKKYFILNILF